MNWKSKYLNRIVAGDCLELMRELPDESVDCVVTSPPYDDLRSYKGYSFDFKGIAKELYRVTKEGGVVVWIVGDATINGSETGTSFSQALFFKEIGFRLHDTMIWKKATTPQYRKRYEPEFEYMFILSKGSPKSFNPIKIRKLYKDNRIVKQGHRNKNGSKTAMHIKQSDWKNKGNIWEISTGGGISTKDKIAYNHPAIFPEELATDHILTWSNEHDIVLDPMCGSGTTCKMAYKLNRNFIGFELSSEYVIIAQKRIKQEQVQGNFLRAKG
jgi:site-specific DNA-methyltransferase (adenine-specific)